MPCHLWCARGFLVEVPLEVMNAFLQMSACGWNYARLVVRALWLAGEVMLAFTRFSCVIAVHCGIPDAGVRALWLHRACRRFLRVFSVHLHISGPVPTTGLLACNHLSYLDILVLAAAAPCIFVSKQEVKSWPVFGWGASLAGTLFLNRDRRSEVSVITRRMNNLLANGALIVVFPEGTTTDGQTVLPFKSSLLEPATNERMRAEGRSMRDEVMLTAGCISYSRRDGSAAEEVCYWGDMTLVPHLVNLLRNRRIDAQLSFSEIRSAQRERKELARQLHAEVVRLKAACSFSLMGAGGTDALPVLP